MITVNLNVNFCSIFPSSFQLEFPFKNSSSSSGFILSPSYDLYHKGKSDSNEKGRTLSLDIDLPFVCHFRLKIALNSILWLNCTLRKTIEK